VNDLNTYLFVSSALFCIGLTGVLVRRNVIVIYMCLELMLNACNIALIAFSRFNHSIDGSLFVFFTITIAAAEIAVGLAIIVTLFRKRQTVLTSGLNLLRY
jgi:NADH-quinone oxidoreductase subunit K